MVNLIKKIKNKKTGEYDVEITDLKIRSSQINKLPELKNNKLLDEKF